MAFNPQEMMSNFASSIKIDWMGVFYVALQYGVYLVIGISIALTLWGLATFFLFYKYKIYYKEARDIQTDATGRPIDGAIINERKWRWDFARVIYKDGVLKWKYLFCRQESKPVDYQFIGKGNKVYMWRTGHDVFIPLIKETHFNIGNHEITNYMPMPTDIKYWEHIRMRELSMKYGGEEMIKKLMKYFIIALVVLGIVLLVGGWLQLKMISVAWEQMTQVGGALHSVTTSGAPY